MVKGRFVGGRGSLRRASTLLPVHNLELAMLILCAAQLGARRGDGELRILVRRRRGNWGLSKVLMWWSSSRSGCDRRPGCTYQAKAYLAEGLRRWIHTDTWRTRDGLLRSAQRETELPAANGIPHLVAKIGDVVATQFVGELIRLGLPLVPVPREETRRRSRLQFVGNSWCLGGVVNGLARRPRGGWMPNTRTLPYLSGTTPTGLPSATDKAGGSRKHLRLNDWRRCGGGLKPVQAVLYKVPRSQLTWA